MNTISKVIFVALLGLSVFACQNDGQNPYAPYKYEPKTTPRGIRYTIHPEHSQVICTLTPVKEGASTSFFAFLEGDLPVEGDRLVGGSASLNVEGMIIELPGNGASQDAGIKGKQMFNTTRFKEARLELAKMVESFDEVTGGTHLVSVNLSFRNKKRGIEVPARIVVAENHLVFTTQPFPVDLTEWGMQPEKSGWKNSAMLSIRIRGDKTPANQPKE